jgi:hypothetical protein
MKTTLVSFLVMMSISAIAEPGSEQSQQQQVSFDKQQQTQDMSRDYNYDYGYGSGIGPGRTLRWQLMNSSKAPKLMESTVSIYVGGRLVNEILLRADSNPVDVSNVVAYLSNGQRLELYASSGDLRTGEIRRLRLDSRYSLRIERIEFSISSPRLIGSRGVLNTYVGFAD